MLTIGQTTSPEKVTLRYATLDSSLCFGEHRDGGDGRSLAVRPIRTANLGAARPEGEGANPNYDDNK